VPPLERPERTPRLRLPPRTGLRGGSADVVVVGGGPSGLGAAVGAAHAGADVILVERHGFLGGNATAALVMPLMSFHNEVRAARDSPLPGLPRLLPADHGPGEPVVGGVLHDLLAGLVAMGGAIAPAEETGYTVPFDPECYKLATLDLLDSAGVRFLFHAFATDLIDDGGVHGVVLETKSGAVVLEAPTIIDCTGDGDVAAAAGAPWERGRDIDELTQPMTLMFRMVEFDRPRFSEYVSEHPDQWRGVHGLWNLVADAHAAGELDLAREDMLFFATPHEREVSVNSTRVPGRGDDVWDLTRAEWATRRQMRQIVRFLQKRVPGFEDAYAAQSGVVGVRETRRIIGDYVLTGEDVLTARQFEDSIARGSYPIDIHNPKGQGTVLRRLPLASAYDIPLRCLLPAGVDGLLVAGRCISGTHEAHSSYRVTPIAMATGQAAGVCAALAVARGVTAREVDHREVQRELVRQGASLRPEIAESLAA
jgi:glycine/D-amino acid oxidase-like deaminating enzyme